MRWLGDSHPGPFVKSHSGETRADEKVRAEMTTHTLDFGNKETLEDLSDLLQTWRSGVEVSMLSNEDEGNVVTAAATTDPLLEGDALKQLYVDVYRAWRLVKSARVSGTLVGYMKRFRKANLYKCYQRALDGLYTWITSGEKGSASAHSAQKEEAKERLFFKVFREFSNAQSIEHSPEAKEHFQAFSKDIEHGQRWSLLAEGLGQAALCLISTRTGCDTWVENKNNGLATLCVWVDMLQQNRGDALAAAGRACQYFTAAIHGRPVLTKRLKLERMPRSEITTTS